MNPTTRRSLRLSCIIAAVLTTAIAPASAQTRGSESDWTLDPEAVERDAADETYDKLRVRLSLGGDYSQGDYGVAGPKTRNASINAGARIELEPVTLRVSVPFALNNGCDLPEEGCVATRSSSTNTGIGDVVTGLTYTWYPGRAGLPLIDFTTKVKIPTASKRKGLGTGATDVTLQIEALQNIGALYVFAGGGYRFKGGSAFDDIIVASGGLGWRISTRVTIGAAYDFREASTSTAKDSHEIVPSLTVKLGDHTRLSPYGVIGLSNAAPDWGIGSTLSYEF